MHIYFNQLSLNQLPEEIGNCFKHPIMLINRDDRNNILGTMYSNLKGHNCFTIARYSIVLKLKIHLFTCNNASPFLSRCLYNTPIISIYFSYFDLTRSLRK